MGCDGICYSAVDLFDLDIILLIGRDRDLDQSEGLDLCRATGNCLSRSAPSMSIYCMTRVYGSRQMIPGGALTRQNGVLDSVIRPSCALF